MASGFTIVGLGEALFDMFPDRQVLGGAPLNMAVHAHQLSVPAGGRAVMVSRIGQDELGIDVAEQLKQRGMFTDYLQTDPDRATGKVYISTDASGEPEYEIVQNVAWDWIQFDPEDDALATRCDAVSFGTLAQRCSEARSSILRFVGAAKRAIRLFDVNLRQDYFDQRILRRSCELANAIKLNESELTVINKLLSLVGKSTDGDAKSTDEAISVLIKRFDLNLLALTRGKQGTVLYTPDNKVEAESISYDAVENADPVGAGDACAAGLLVGLVQRWPLDRTLTLANHAGAYVASQPGATPVLPDSIVKLIR